MIHKPAPLNFSVENEGHTLKEIRFFGRRKGKNIKGSRSLLMDELLPKVALDRPTQMLDLNAVFGIQPKEVWLEIGFGGGEHLAEQALNHQDVGIIGAEPFLNGVASLLAHLNGSHMKEALNADLAQGRVDNVRIWSDDVRILFPFIADASFKRIFVLYPDPWPKARHAERRFINQANLRHLHRLLTDDGALFVATDVADYAVWAEEQAALSGLFDQTNTDTRMPPPNWVPTRYEKKGIEAGRKPTYLVFSKKR